MLNLGQQLKAAREGKGVTASQAAAATRMKVQTIEALEREDFARIPAPMYVKGFIKMYAEYLALDPAPLLRDYQQRHAPPEQSRPAAEDVLRSPSGAKVLKPKTAERRWIAFPIQLRQIPAHHVRRVALGAGALLLVLLLGLSLHQCARRPRAAGAAAPAVDRTTTRAVPPPAGQPPWIVVKPAPEPYLKQAKTTAPTP